MALKQQSDFFTTREAAEMLGLKSSTRIQQICIEHSIGQKFAGVWALTKQDIERIRKFTRNKIKPTNGD